MVERFKDRLIRVVENIYSLEGNDLSNSEVKMTDTELESVISHLENKGFIRVENRCPVPMYDEAREYVGDSPDDILITYGIPDWKKFKSFFEELKNKKTSKRDRPRIQPKALELIAKKMGDLETGNELIKFLKNNGVDAELIIYPNTKWRMVYDVLEYLANSGDQEDQKTLFKIIEGVCHPLMYNGDKSLADKATAEINSFIEYDQMTVKDGVLWNWFDGPYGIEWIDKNGTCVEPPTYLILPERINELYVYWNEIIKLAKFYFANRDSQDDEINSIYFEIITRVEKILETNACGDLKETYKKPFRNIIGSEFEIQKQGLTQDGLFVNLYDFLGQITECMLPDKNEVEKIKKENSSFFVKIAQYYEQHLARKALKIQEPPTQKIEIVSLPPLEFKQIKEKLPLYKKNLKSVQIIYKDDEATIDFDGQAVSLPPYKNEHYFCREMFKHLAKEPIDWSTVYESMTKSTVSDQIKNKRAVLDTMYAINKRIKGTINSVDELFVWNEKTVTRQF